MIGVFDTVVSLPKALSLRKAILSPGSRLKVKNLRKLIRAILLLEMVIAGFQVNGYAGISLAGTSGLINIPTAEVSSDQQLTLGIGYMNRHSAYLETHRCDNFPCYIVLGYLPRLEFSAGVMLVPGQKSYDGTNTYKDGIVSLQYLLLKEKKFLPALAIGARDVYSFILLNTTFIVATKTIFHQSKSSVRCHFGYGSAIIDHHLGVPKRDRKFPVGHTIVGVFGGLEFRWKEVVSYLLEYDTQRINTGFRFRVKSILNFDLCLLNMQDLGGGVNFSVKL